MAAVYASGSGACLMPEAGIVAGGRRERSCGMCIASTTAAASIYAHGRRLLLPSIVGNLIMENWRAGVSMRRRRHEKSSRGQRSGALAPLGDCYYQGEK